MHEPNCGRAQPRLCSRVAGGGNDWEKLSPCKYDSPADPYVAVILEQNVAREQCAITVYKNLVDFMKDKNMVTYHLALTILEQEVEYEEDLESLKDDLEWMVQRGSC